MTGVGGGPAVTSSQTAVVGDWLRLDKVGKGGLSWTLTWLSSPHPSSDWLQNPCQHQMVDTPTDFTDQFDETGNVVAAHL